jgi:hypothetical protein
MFSEAGGGVSFWIWGYIKVLLISLFEDGY